MRRATSGPRPAKTLKTALPWSKWILTHMEQMNLPILIVSLNACKVDTLLVSVVATTNYSLVSLGFFKNIFIFMHGNTPL